MSIRTVIVVLLALVFGGTASMSISHLRATDGEESTVQVVVAKGEISRGTTLTKELVTTVAYPKDHVPAGALTKVEDVVDHVLTSAVVKDEPILEGKLAGSGANGMAWRIPKGMRGFTIGVPNIASGVGGHIQPGDHVDVLLSLLPQQRSDDLSKLIVVNILQFQEILAVDQREEAPLPGERRPEIREMHSVTLLVTPEQADILTLGQSRGTLQLVLRRPDDNTALTGTKIVHNLRDLIKFLEPPKPPEPVVQQPLVAKAPEPVKEVPKPRRQGHVMTVYNGGNIVRAEFGSDGETPTLNMQHLQDTQEPRKENSPRPTMLGPQGEQVGAPGDGRMR
jgi:pilus assembly protein CpaB